MEAPCKMLCAFLEVRGTEGPKPDPSFHIVSICMVSLSAT